MVRLPSQSSPSGACRRHCLERRTRWGEVPKPRCRAGVWAIPWRGPSCFHRRVSIDFRASPPAHPRCQWEFALVDKVTRDLSNTASELFASVRRHEGADVPRLHKELRSTIEVVTGTCGSVDEAVHDLTGTLGWSGTSPTTSAWTSTAPETHPFAPWAAQLVTPGHRYDTLIERTQWWGRQLLIWGVHVHVGVRRRDHVLPIISSLLNQLPHLQALSALPRRSMRVPTPGTPAPARCSTSSCPPPGSRSSSSDGRSSSRSSRRRRRRESSSAPEGISAGTSDLGMSSARWRVRVCDGVSTMHELRALVALTHCLVVDLEARLDLGETLPTLPAWHVRENKWRAAQLRARRRGDRRQELRRESSPTTSTTCCCGWSHRQGVWGAESDLASVAEIPTVGAGYERQRKVAAGAGSQTLTGRGRLRREGSPGSGGWYGPRRRVLGRVPVSACDNPDMGSDTRRRLARHFSLVLVVAVLGACSAEVKGPSEEEGARRRSRVRRGHPRHGRGPHHSRGDGDTLRQAGP